MPKKHTSIPSEAHILQVVGEQIRLARLRRNFSAAMVADRAGMSRPTLLSIEKGQSTVRIGHYFNVLKVFGLERDFLFLAKEDGPGRKLQDIELMTKKRVGKRKSEDGGICG